MTIKIRKPVVAGQFYTADFDALKTEVEQKLDLAVVRSSQAVQALIVPHAGYSFSGDTAGYAYGLLRDQHFKRVVVIAPSHHLAFQEVSYGNYSSFATPLGELMVDQETCAKLKSSNPLFSARDDAHHLEHSLEVQLPFIKSLFPKISLIPLICGQLNYQQITSVAKTLHEQLATDDTLWIISSDFTHLGHAFNYLPFTKNIEDNLTKLDLGAINEILDNNPKGFYDYKERTKATICGFVPITILLETFSHNSKKPQTELLNYTNSGKLTHDFSHSVSYASISFYKSTIEDNDWSLSAKQKNILLTLARQEIRKSLKLEIKSPININDLPKKLHEKAACFVTLHLHNKLRGCIGTLEAIEPLFKNVQRNAKNAAFYDYRFNQVKADDVEELKLEISVLTPQKEITNLDDFIIGKHGIIFQKGKNSAVFLPQVALEQGWNKEETLAYLAMKSGLDADAWRRKGAKFAIFQAIVFKEYN